MVRENVHTIENTLYKPSKFIWCQTVHKILNTKAKQIKITQPLNFIISCKIMMPIIIINNIIINDIIVMCNANW